MSDAPAFEGQRVQLRGLSREVLNGAVGVAAALDAATGRIPVRLEGPQAALDAFPGNVKARRCPAGSPGRFLPLTAAQQPWSLAARRAGEARELGAGAGASGPGG